MKVVGIYDVGEEYTDRYTVVTDQKDRIYYEMLGLSEGGRAVSQWSSGQWSETSDNKHLGKRVRFEDLSEDTQKHIAERIFA